MHTGVCRAKACKAKVLWVKTAAGNDIPLDPDPVPDGNVLLVDDRAQVLGPAALEDLEADAVRYRSHFLTCPAAASFQRRRRKTEPSPAQGRLI